MATNTGFKGYAKLLKVTGDGTNLPLDVNNELCSVSGLPQDFKDNNIGDPDYIEPVYDETVCPIDEPEPDLYYLIVDCVTSDLYTAELSSLIVGDIAEFIPTGHVGLPRCGEITNDAYPSLSPPTSTLTGLTRDCGDAVHCDLT